uniref:Uncharacterized protein n=1 Tax=Glossina pallidipes TaxID=7398 RepID=A0A1B0ACS9_GLOPL
MKKPECCDLMNSLCLRALACASTTLLPAIIIHVSLEASFSFVKEYLLVERAMLAEHEYMASTIPWRLFKLFPSPNVAAGKLNDVSRHLNGIFLNAGLGGYEKIPLKAVNITSNISEALGDLNAYGKINNFNVYRNSQQQQEQQQHEQEQSNQTITSPVNFKYLKEKKKKLTSIHGTYRHNNCHQFAVKT